MTLETCQGKEKYDVILKEILSQRSLHFLEKIYDALTNNKEQLYNDEIIPYQFSNDFIWFLKNNYIEPKIQMDIFKLYIQEFFSLNCKWENLSKIKFIYGIFNYDCYFFKMLQKSTICLPF